MSGPNVRSTILEVSLVIATPVHGSLMMERHVEPPTSETVRVAHELMEMAREFCFNTRTSQGKRLKLTQYIDSLLRAAIIKDHKAMQKRLSQERKESKE
ncbi:MAG: hypothetical protein KGL39_42920 [Patescibacteria group bacterium]|nr:hypothetical protein [Patescibacteria group bacterium]